MPCHEMVFLTFWHAKVGFFFQLCKKKVEKLNKRYAIMIICVTPIYKYIK